MMFPEDDLEPSPWAVPIILGLAIASWGFIGAAVVLIWAFL